MLVVLSKMKRITSVFTRHKLMEQGIDAFDGMVKEPERAPKLAGAAAGVATPMVAVAATAELTGLAGGAAILKTLAVAGAAVGGGAIAGIAVVGVGSVAIGWGVTRLVKRARSKNQTD